jgi:hypothetical protein
MYIFYIYHTVIELFSPFITHAINSLFSPFITHPSRPHPPSQSSLPLPPEDTEGKSPQVHGGGGVVSSCGGLSLEETPSVMASRRHGQRDVGGKGWEPGLQPQKMVEVHPWRTARWGLVFQPGRDAQRGAHRSGHAVVARLCGPASMT